MWEYIAVAAAVIIVGLCAWIAYRIMKFSRKAKELEDMYSSRPMNKPLNTQEIEGLRHAADGLPGFTKKRVAEAIDEMEGAMKKSQAAKLYTADEYETFINQYKQQISALDPESMQKYAEIIKQYGGLGSFTMPGAAEQLEKLAELKDKGAITEEEFEAAKKQIIGL